VGNFTWLDSTNALLKNQSIYGLRWGIRRHCFPN
jgi:hypothetical protein